MRRQSLSCDPLAKGWSTGQQILVCRACKAICKCTDKDPGLYACTGCGKALGRGAYAHTHVDYKFGHIKMLRCTDRGPNTEVELHLRSACGPKRERPEFP